MSMRAMAAKGEKYEGDHVAGVEEFTKPRVCISPGRPSKKEIAEREVTRLPFRSWCPHCVEGRGHVTPHYSKNKAKDEDKLPTIGMDYGLLGEDDGQAAPVLVIKDGKSGVLHGFMVQSKVSSTIAQ